MAELYGWVGKILFVDLTSGTSSTLPTTNYVPKWIGGRALAAKLYWDEVPPSCKAFDPANSLIFASGPANGTPGAGSTRTAVATKSPESNPECYMHSVPGGHWSAELKFAGYDAVVVRGKAAKPSYILIRDGEVTIKAAGRLWGLPVSQAETEIRRQWGDRTRTMIIGPAGENLCKNSVILTDLGHATGQGGFGAVMGSKNLKAIAVRGSGGVKVSRPKDLIAFYDQYVKIGGKYGGPYVVSSEAYNTFHGTGNLKDINIKDPKTGKHIAIPAEQIGKETEDIDTRFNNVDGYWVNYYLGQEEVMAGTLKRKFEGCFSCPACCGLAYKALDPTGNEPAPKNLNPPMTSGSQCYEYPHWNEFEAAAFQGKRMGRPGILSQSSWQEMGLTMFGFGYHLFLFLEAVEAGLLTEANTGLPCGDLARYNTEAMIGKDGFVYGITYRRNDFFKRLAEGFQQGIASLAKENAAWDKIYKKYDVNIAPYHICKWGHKEGSYDHIGMLVKATEFKNSSNPPLGNFTEGGKAIAGFVPAAEITAARKAVRAKWAPLLGAKSFDLDGETPTWQDKVGTVIFFQNMQIEADSMPYCGWAAFPRFYSPNTPDHVGDPNIGANMLAAVTGIDRTFEENVKAMEAAWTLERAIHAREGHRREHDMLTPEVFEANKSWVSKDEFGKVLDDYYTARGWDKATGIPTRTQLVKLGMTDVADDLEKKYGVKVPA